MDSAKSRNLTIAVMALLALQSSAVEIELTPDSRPLFDRMWATLVNGQYEFVRDEFVPVACDPLLKNYFVNDFRSLGVDSEPRKYTMDEWDQCLVDLRVSHSRSFFGCWSAGSKLPKIALPELPPIIPRAIGLTAQAASKFAPALAGATIAIAVGAEFMNWHTHKKSIDHEAKLEAVQKMIDRLNSAKV